MIDFELFSKIKTYHDKKGLKPTQIARELGLDSRTVNRWLNERNFHPRKSYTRRATKLAPFKDSIIQLLSSHPYSAVQIMRRIQEEGFTGSYTIVKDYVRKVRQQSFPAFPKLPFEPGECAQVDWGSFHSIRIGQTRRRLSFFVMVLCYSRLMYVEFTVSRTMEHWLSCHQNAFEAFGGVPSKIVVGDLKSAVLKRIIGQAPAFNPVYLDFANHAGFTITPCGIGNGNERGGIENAVGYIKKNFLSVPDLPTFDAINPAVRIWLDSVANVRIPKETRTKPLEMFEEEKSFLLPLPQAPYDFGSITEVRASTQFRVTFDTNHYSVPAQYAGAKLTLKSYPERIAIYHDGKLISCHSRSYGRNKYIEAPHNPKELITRSGKAPGKKIFMRFLSLSPKAQDYYRELEKSCMNPPHHVKRIVALSEIYGPDRVARAMDQAFFFQDFSWEYIENHCELLLRQTPEPGAVHLARRNNLFDLEVQVAEMPAPQSTFGTERR